MTERTFSVVDEIGFVAVVDTLGFWYDLVAFSYTVRSDGRA